MMIDKETNTVYTYSEELFSDFHKDAYGFRPRDHRFYDADTTPAEKQEIWDATGRAMDRAIADEKAEAARAVVDFEEEVRCYIELGAGDRQTALRWMTPAQPPAHRHSPVQALPPLRHP